MASYDFDLFTIGAGSGGVRASRVSAGYGARVAVAEERDLGGTCVNVGCIPKKLLVYASAFRDDFQDADAYGWTLGPRSHDWTTLVSNKDREIARLNGIYAGLLDGAGVTRIEGRARIVAPHTVDVAGRRYSARHILIAVGGWPQRPDIPGIEYTLTSNEAFHLKSLPRRVIVVGGGYIAVELAGIFAGLGADVVQLYPGPLFQRGFDDDVRAGLAAEMRGSGVELRFDANPARIERAADGSLVAELEDGERLSADAVLYATGRAALTGDLGLETVGVEVRENGSIPVDGSSRMRATGSATNAAASATRCLYPRESCPTNRRRTSVRSHRPINSAYRLRGTPPANAPRYRRYSSTRSSSQAGAPSGSHPRHL